MRLAIFFPVNVLCDGNRFYTADYRHYQFSEIARHFASTDLVVFTRNCKPGEAEGLERIDTSRMNVVGIPGYWEPKPFLTESGWERRVAKLPYLFASVARMFFRKRAEWDVLLLFDPYFTNLFLSLLAGLTDKPAVAFLGARWDRNVLLNARHESFDRRLANTVKSLIYRATIPLMVRRLPTVVTGDEIYQHYHRAGVKFKRIAATVVQRAQIDPRIVAARAERSGVQRLIVVCRITMEKGLEYLIQAVGMLKQRQVDVELTIVGPVISARYYAVLQDQVQSSAVEDRVKFVGAVNRRDDILQLYADSDVFVLPSISEGSPKVIPEAMAKGIPVVASRVGGIPELVKDGINGLLVEPRDPIGLAGAIERIVTDRDLRRALGEGSLAEAENYTLEVQMAQFANFIKAACRSQASAGTIGTDAGVE